ncbi:outer membrane receptor protein involved in Fe transport [Sphingobium sp. B1D7B]|uniref:TonB-dependent receptor domain-containing protein n=1 Tax=Sphingobium sp. B1D7B TaxID=2940578 RepID=UPI002224F182|nr:TonB-dependent receptor [Sphingobium sp. B1D7B]MCW2406875.1 outer membrane receptor protein involved in Fe transport [Sphingobium sp. B1D7B]
MKARGEGEMRRASMHVFLTAGCSAFALLAFGNAGSAVAQTTSGPSASAVKGASEEPAQAESEATTGDIVVTGSRLGASGFNAPTPVTAASADALRAAAPTSIAEGLVQLPVFGGSTRAGQSGGGSVSQGNAGQNLLNLRSLGANRTLVLLDGRRLVSTNQGGSVDVNIIPQGLVRQVDVVTGGASAAYGSDAVAGVVNFVLDTKFEGIKGEVSGGMSTYGDTQTVLANLSFGKSFADGRVRLIANAEYSRTNGVGVDDDTGRGWYKTNYGQLPNPTTGATPGILVIPDIRSSVGTNGGLITAGPLRGTQFLAGGATSAFNYGTVTGSSFQSGGDGARADNGLSPDQKRWNLFAHLEVEPVDGLTFFAEGEYAKSTSLSKAFYTQHIGGSGRFTIFRDNAYLPTGVLSQMVTTNQQSIQVGRFFRDLPIVENENSTEMKRIAIGANADLWGRWKADASYSFGQTDQHLYQNNRTNLRRIYAAVDAVKDATGKIVCRSTLAGLDPGCVPLNIFGEGSVTPEAAAWVVGDSGKDLRLRQHVFQVNLNGDLGDNLQFGAGPISIAVGAEHRRESARQVADAVSQQILDFTGVRGAPTSLQGRIGVYQSNNPQPLAGRYNVTDLYAEVGAPILRDRPFFNALDLHGAVRRTNYSQSGVVMTWKLGGVWEPVDGIRLRYTRSRDIRGPNILELFNSQTQVIQNVIYQGQTYQDLVIISGNPNLGPEKALTETYGIVVRPSFLPGFQASVDRFNIEISGAIGTLTPQNTVDLCARGNQTLCDQITVTGPNTLTIRQQTLNLDQARVGGFDFEVAYAKPLWGGRIQARILATHLTKSETQAIGSSAIQTLRSPATPLWRGTASLRYEQDRWSALIQERVIGSAVIDPMLVEGVGTSLNHINAIAYTDLTFEYKLRAFGGDQKVYVTVNNLLNQEPPISGGNPTSFSVPAAQTYDLIGRFITAGIRFNF